MLKRLKPIALLGLLMSIFVLSGCEYVVLDSKGPVAQIQKDLILFSIFFMLLIVVVVYLLFLFIVVRYRERKETQDYEPPEQEGSKRLETLWTVIPILIVIALAIPTVKAIYALERPPKGSEQVPPLVIHATSVDWKWIFSYPEQNIETINHLVIPEDRAILFKLTSADSMASFWIPALGGQKYAMAGMQTELYLQADAAGTYEGRNANFTGEGFTEQQFKVTSMITEEFDNWVLQTQSTASKLTREKYDQLMLQGHSPELTFSSTHLEWVNHVNDPEYALRVREKEGLLPQGTVDSTAPEGKQTPNYHSGSHK
ncbi:cytochrome aa3 quinol oxidase subunit II [Cohnella boryungensis]|uniref:Quinol oxidase subunit 2 n=1 Tax=Cohnella boryungensis TaxID=768479 RepID=A0ABV8SHY3_9BACL